MLGADDREHERLGVAIDRREERPAAGLHEAPAGRDDRSGVRDVFEHLHAGDDVEPFGQLIGERLHRDLAVGDARRRCLDRVELGHLERLGSEVDAEHVGTTARHRVGKDAAAAADVEDALALQRREAIDPVEAQRIDLMQRPEVALGIPPAVGEVAELGELARVGIGGHEPMLPTSKQKAPQSGAF